MGSNKMQVFFDPAAKHGMNSKKLYELAYICYN